MKITTPKATYKKYSTYKDSEVEWLGEIPKDWGVYRLASLGSFSASGIDKKIDPAEQLVRIINFVDVFNAPNFRLSEREYMTVSTVPEKRLKNQVKKGDLIFTPSSEVAEEIGISAVVDEPLKNTAFSYHVLRYQFNNSMKVEHDLRKYIVNNKFVLSQFSKRASGSIRKTLVRKDFKNVVVVYPPINLQTTLANFLDHKTTQIDSMIEKKKKLNELLKEKRQALITHAVTKGLDPNAKMMDSFMPTVSKIPANWKIKPMWSVTTLRTQKGSEGVLLSVYLDKGVIPASEGSLGTHAPSLDMSNYQIVQPGDFVLNNQQAWRGSVGISTYTGLISPAYVIFKLSEELHPLFADYLMRDYTMVDQFMISSRGVGDIQRQLNIRQLKYSVVPIPPRDEQISIGEYLEKKVIAINKIIEKIQLQIVKLREFKSALIYNAVTGKIKV